MRDFSSSSQTEQSMPHVIKFHADMVNLGTETQQVEATQQSPGSEAEEGGKLAPPVAKSSRMFFMDHLRAFLVIGVIMGHLAMTYGWSINGWYYQDTTDALTTGLVTIFTTIGAVFGLGLLFFISAYFTPGAYDRKGTGPFLRDRLLRLGLPLLICDLLIHPFTLYIAAGFPGSFWNYYTNYILTFQEIWSGLVWFLEFLLFFAMFYALWRVCSTWWLHAHPRMTIPMRSITSERLHPYPTTGAMVLFIIGLALLSFVVRIWFLSGWWFVPQFISMFILGLIAYRRGWLTSIPDEVGKRWFWVALMDLLFFVLLFLLNAMVGLGGSIYNFLGGLHWQALVFAFWEAILCVAMCTCLLVFFRKHVNRPGRVWDFLSANAYAAFLISPVILVAVAYSLHTIALYPLLKYGVAAIIAVPLCFLIGSAIRRIPLVNRVL